MNGLFEMLKELEVYGVTRKIRIGNRNPEKGGDGGYVVPCDVLEVVQNVLSYGQTPALCIGVQPRELPSPDGPAETDPALDDDNIAGEAHKVRCEGGEPSAVHGLPDGRGCCLKGAACGHSWPGCPTRRACREYGGGRKWVRLFKGWGECLQNGPG